jgi:hypothetical protein
LKERSRMELFEVVRREFRDEDASIRELAARHGVRRRTTVRAALADALPPQRKTPGRRSPVLGAYQDTVRTTGRGPVGGPSGTLGPRIGVTFTAKGGRGRRFRAAGALAVAPACGAMMASRVEPRGGAAGLRALSAGRNEPGLTGSAGWSPGRAAEALPVDGLSGVPGRDHFGLPPAAWGGQPRLPDR